MLKKICKLSVILLFITSLSIFSGCYSQSKTDKAVNQPKNSEFSNVPAKADPVELSKIINLNKKPEELVYKEIKLAKDTPNERLPAPTDKKFVAVLKFSPEETKRIIERAKNYRKPVSVEIDAENWFPAGLVAKSQNSGDGSLKGKTYAATDFLKTPYTDGKLTRIENTEYLILELIAF